MRLLPLMVFAASAGVGSGMASFKYASQLNYDNAMLTLRVHQAERRIADLHEQRAVPRELSRPNAFAAGERERTPRSEKRGSRR